MTCEVCCEKFNRSNHKLISCPYCPFQVCATCAERYLLDTDQDAHCMACRKAWDRQVLVSNFTSKFVTKTYKARRENLLLDRERSLMPATQPYVEIAKKIQKIIGNIHKMNRKIEELEQQRVRIASTNAAVHAVENNFENEFEAHVDIRRRVFETVKIIGSHRLDVEFLKWQKTELELRMGENLASERRQFVRACPANDCKGFLSTAWKCGLCDNWTCPDCHEVIGPDKTVAHTCNESHLATARLLARDSRPCPKCAALIFKIDGCDQMYCTQCHTAFSWRKGTIETGTIHNPHYYEFQRRNGTLARNPGDVPCGGMPSWRALVHKWKLFTHNTPLVTFLANVHRIEGHVRWIVIPRYTVNLHHENRDLRIKFMMDEMDEEEFKRKIQQREKARARKNDIRQVLEMLVTVLVDLFQEFDRSGDIHVLETSLHELKEHVNTTLKKVSNRWSKCTVPFFNSNFDVV